MKKFIMQKNSASQDASSLDSASKNNRNAVKRVNRYHAPCSNRPNDEVKERQGFPDNSQLWRQGLLRSLSHSPTNEKKHFPETLQDEKKTGSDLNIPKTFKKLNSVENHSQCFDAALYGDISLDLSNDKVPDQSSSISSISRQSSECSADSVDSTSCDNQNFGYDIDVNSPPCSDKQGVVKRVKALRKLMIQRAEHPQESKQIGKTDYDPLPPEIVRELFSGARTPTPPSKPTFLDKLIAHTISKQSSKDSGFSLGTKNFKETYLTLCKDANKEVPETPTLKRKRLARKRNNSDALNKFVADWITPSPKLLLQGYGLQSAKNSAEKHQDSLDETCTKSNESNTYPPNGEVAAPDIITQPKCYSLRSKPESVTASPTIIDSAHEAIDNTSLVTLAEVASTAEQNRES